MILMKNRSQCVLYFQSRWNVVILLARCRENRMSAVQSLE